MTQKKHDYLSQQQTVALKGLLALCVLTSHVVPASGVFSGSILNPLVASLGYLSVSVFFFLSGYGIMAQYAMKREQYLEKFLRNRILSIYLMTFFLVILYAVFHTFAGNQFPISQLLQSLTFGATIVPNGWYLQVVTLFYLIWYLSFRFVDRSNVRSTAICVAILMYMCIAAVFLSTTWWECSLSFLLGICWQKNKERIDEMIFAVRGRWALLLAGVLATFCLCFLLASKRFLPLSTETDFLFRMFFRVLSSALFVVLALLAVGCIDFTKCSVFCFLGRYSIEIYILQGIPLHLFKTGVLAVRNGWLYVSCVVIGTILISVMLHPVIQVVANIPRKQLSFSNLTFDKR